MALGYQHWSRLKKRQDLLNRELPGNELLCVAPGKIPSKCNGRLWETDFLCFSIGMTETDRPLFLRTLTSAARSSKSMVENECSKLAPVTKDLENLKGHSVCQEPDKVWVPHSSGTVWYDENHWNLLHFDHEEKARNVLQGRKDVDQAELPWTHQSIHCKS